MAATTTGLRRGYTTGACAAAAARGAMQALLNQSAPDMVYITLQKNNPTPFRIQSCDYDTHRATCSVIKDAGDDPDITDGIEICATASWRGEPGLTIDGGRGIGRVTKEGLELPVGEAAINPEPRRMIAEAVTELPGTDINNRGIEIVISAPDGKRLARRTLNDRLGISGGISILGTSGYVIPYSTDAYRATITLGISVAKARGLDDIVLTTGRRSEKYAQAELQLPEECYVQAGDHIGLALDECVRRDIRRIFIWGMVGKLSKLAGGEFYTHVDKSLVDINSLASLAEEIGVDDNIFIKLERAVTAHHFQKLLPPRLLPKFNGLLCRRAAAACSTYTGDKAEIRVIMSDYQGNITGRSYRE